MRIIPYEEKYQEQVIELILHIQNEEAGIHLSIQEQPDLLNIPLYYEQQGGEFWLAVDGQEVIGKIALMNYHNGNGVLKKFFVKKERRKQKVGFVLYQTLINKAKEDGYHQLLLDTPSVAAASHRFYEREGFVRITKEELPFPYTYPDRDSYLYLLKMA
jgi:GNAT superfamily N-acetyltransferase